MKLKKREQTVFRGAANWGGRVAFERSTCRSEEIGQILVPSGREPERLQALCKVEARLQHLAKPPWA